ncbi:MAG: PASTA domain-containing protein, partial [Ferruginibacter sp.]|nr:PASTA domain-containing protein [Ferruginibacter sp.]
KEISDHIYSRFISTAPLNEKLTPDTTLYSYYGVRNDLASIFNYLNIPSTDSSSSGFWRTATIKGNSAGLNLTSQAVTGAYITPDVKGMGLKDAVYLLENKGFRTAVSGKGRVVNQSITAGANFNKGQKIILMLN